MNPFRRHRPKLELSRYVDGELRPAQSRTVRAHLEDCPRCRRVVQEYRQIAEAARSFQPDPPDDRILERVLERRAAGDRVILPVEMPRLPVEPRRAPRWIAAAALVVVGLAAVLALPPLASADRPGLFFMPAVPLPGQVVEVRYTGSERFALAESLVLRARLVTADGRSRLAEVTTLAPDEDGFRGMFRLADSVVYAEFALESLGGDVVDSNGRRYWQLVTADPETGRPSRAALGAQVETLHRRAPVLAIEAAERLTRAYPDRPESWYRRAPIELSVYGSLPKALSAIHEERIKYFSEAQAAGRLEAGDLPWLIGYLRLFGRDAAHVMATIGSAGLMHPILLQWSLIDLQLAGATPAQILTFADSIWMQGNRAPALADAALTAAIEITDRNAVEKWISATLELSGSERRRDLLFLITSSPELARVLVDQLDTMVEGRRWNDAGVRPLHATHAEHTRLIAPLLQDALARSADQLLSDGDTARAITHYRQASEAWWDRDALLEIAAALDAAGAIGASTVAANRADMVGAIRGPAGPRPREGGSRPIDAAWSQLRTDVMHSATNIYLDPAIRVHHSGKPVRVDQIGRGEIRVLAVDDTRYPRRREEDLASLTDALDRVGVRFIHVLAGADPETCARQSSAVCDPDRQLVHELGVARTLDFFVMDRQGRIRFAHVPADQIVLLPSVLRAALPQPPPIASK